MFNQVTQNILRELASGEFCSGEQLGEANGVSRAAIGKHIQALVQLGLDIYSVTGKGYRLSLPLELLDVAAIKAAQDVALPLPIVVESVIDSTNNWIKQQISRGALNHSPSGTTVFSEAQTAGRGRRGKQWVSPLGASLYLSTHWRFEQGISATSGLSLVVGIAIVEALTKLGIPNLGLKWPNDVYYQGRKLAGILVELEGQGSDSCDIIIGAGINVHLPENVTQDIDQPYADINEVGLSLSRNHIAGRILSHLIKLLNEFEVSGFSAFVERWHQHDCFIGQHVQLQMGQRQITGVAKGVDTQGGLLLEVDQQVQSFFGGEISLRKLSS
ncbi:MAG: bifunctional biotin--[acetyl-CoA-carboxylase] ligase/biotin operon repressor BirA [Psychrobium sp.]